MPPVEPPHHHKTPQPPKLCTKDNPPTPTQVPVSQIGGRLTPQQTTGVGRSDNTRSQWVGQLLVHQGRGQHEFILPEIVVKFTKSTDEPETRSRTESPIMAANPTSESELQLYRVLQRANLLQYFDTFISQGKLCGDDVQQLCEAGEEEFLEIMALVGMASKPLHVRRLQKALQEWVTNPTVFHQPLNPHTTPPPIAPGSILASVQRPYLKMEPASLSTNPPGPLHLTAANINSWPSRHKMLDTHVPTVTRTSSPSSVICTDSILGDNLLNTNCSVITNGSQQMICSADSPHSGTNSYMADDSLIAGGPQSALTEGQLKAIEKAAEELAKTLPQYQPKPLNMKKFINKEIEVVMNLPEDHPERTDLLRKYAAIYGRFDSHRKNEKTLSLHEISVNEAAAQLCRYQVSLLTRRNDLFPLARQVVRDSGYQYSKGHSRGQPIEIRCTKNDRQEDNGMITNIKTEPVSIEQEQHLREVRMSAINDELSEITIQQQNLKDMLHDEESEPTDQQHLDMLKSQLEALTARQLRLLSEQNSIPFPSEIHDVLLADEGGMCDAQPSLSESLQVAVQFQNLKSDKRKTRSGRTIVKQEPEDEFVQIQNKTNSYGS
ncbi:hypothetical protein LSH36_1227g00010 [Paralvinella palmiformis]|uniref:Uncharacterized protein n=1 Tax=Paralvinella palmiformis TaxID=53620 RepID=A0AAD9IUL5_9ANNE|nr:hypothetical protein LSH36_1227g00010 [Paralvinella palmiformis]